MSGITESSVVIASLGIVATALAALIWITKYLMTEMKKSIDKNTTSHEKVAQNTKANTKVTNETLKFMRNLNGKLAKITAQTITEQKVEHQTIEHQETK